MNNLTNTFNAKNKALNNQINDLNDNLMQLKKKIETNEISNEKEMNDMNIKNEILLKEKNESLVLLNVRSKQLDDTTETISELKKLLKKEENMRRDAEDRANRRSSYKHDLRQVEIEKDEIQQELDECEIKLKNTKSSFNAIRGHLEAIIEEQVRCNHIQYGVVNCIFFLLTYFCFLFLCFFVSSLSLSRSLKSRKN